MACTRCAHVLLGWQGRACQPPQLRTACCIVLHKANKASQSCGSYQHHIAKKVAWGNALQSQNHAKMNILDPSLPIPGICAQAENSVSSWSLGNFMQLLFQPNDVTVLSQGQRILTQKIGKVFFGRNIPAP